MPTIPNGPARRSFACKQIAAIDRKIADLTVLRGELDRLIGACQNGMVAECKILGGLTLPINAQA
ncbi:hypothetical protein [Novosphingobium sp. CECT 9465]|uniref:hypothetical protein n=1 Tax=Novosphingobium sp. CECT 9465 TaxID=2829794 RepID=UPI001E313734|nr:hypothetical protein [Novosphingobium sp. CECT 9465]